VECNTGESRRQGKEREKDEGKTGESTEGNGWTTRKRGERMRARARATGATGATNHCTDLPMHASRMVILNYFVSTPCGARARHACRGKSPKEAA